MEVKKNPKVNLEQYKQTFTLIGLIVALVVVYLVINISQANVKVQDLQGNMNANVEQEQVAVTRQDVAPPPPPPPAEQQVSEVIEIVDDKVKIEDNFNFDTEADDNDAVDFEEIDFDDGDEEVVEEEEPLIWADKMPEFPGGEPALRLYIAENIVYPELATENEIQGTVYVRFVVTKNGSVGEVQITKGVDPLLDEEAQRVVKSLPKFKPGSQGGRPVPIWYSVPIAFKLTN